MVPSDPWWITTIGTFPSQCLGQLFVKARQQQACWPANQLCPPPAVSCLYRAVKLLPWSGINFWLMWSEFVTLLRAHPPAVRCLYQAVMLTSWGYFWLVVSSESNKLLAHSPAVSCFYRAVMLASWGNFWLLKLTSQLWASDCPQLFWSSKKVVEEKNRF